MAAPRLAATSFMLAGLAFAGSGAAPAAGRREAAWGARLARKQGVWVAADARAAKRAPLVHEVNDEEVEDGQE